jgi:hypothetical protein
MDELKIKIREIEKEISMEKGEFNFFALFQHENSLDNWDLVVSGEWVYNHKAEALKYISKKLKVALNQKEIIRISRIIVIDPSNPSLNSIIKEHKIEHGLIEENNKTYFDLDIQQALIISSTAHIASTDKGNLFTGIDKY